MSLKFQVSGPTQIRINTNLLGYTSNDQLVSITDETNLVELTSTRTGEVPGEVLDVGVTHSIDFALTEWDASTAAWTVQHGATNGTVNAIGTCLIDDDKTFSLTIAPLKTGGLQRVYNTCYFTESPHTEEYGNTGLVLSATVKAIPNSSGVLFVESVVS